MLYLIPRSMHLVYKPNLLNIKYWNKKKLRKENFKKDATNNVEQIDRINNNCTCIS